MTYRYYITYTFEGNRISTSPSWATAAHALLAAGKCQDAVVRGSARHLQRRHLHRKQHIMNIREQFSDLISHVLTNGEVDQMEQDAVDGYVSDNVKRLVTTVQVTGDSLRKPVSGPSETQFRPYPRS